MSSIIAYTWEAGCQCIGCTQAQNFKCSLYSAERDINGVLVHGYGRDGGRVRPVFITDGNRDAGLYCDTCGDEIIEPTPERFTA